MAELKIGKRERVILIVVGVAVVLGVAFMMLGGGSDSAVVDVSSAPRVAPGTRPTSSPPPVEAGDSFDTGGAKDPFEPPGGFAVAQSPGGSPGGAQGSGSPTPQATGGVPGRSRVALLDIYTQGGTRFASVQVDGEIHNVKQGDTFSSTYRVVTITDSCATFVQGDERFTLCIGQQVYK